MKINMAFAVPFLLVLAATCLLIGYVFSRLLNISKGTCFAFMGLVAIASVVVILLSGVEDDNSVIGLLAMLVWGPTIIGLLSAVFGSLIGRAQKKQGDDLHRLAAKFTVIGAGVATALIVLGALFSM